MIFEISRAAILPSVRSALHALRKALFSALTLYSKLNFLNTESPPGGLPWIFLRNLDLRKVDGRATLTGGGT